MRISVTVIDRPLFAKLAAMGRQDGARAVLHQKAEEVSGMAKEECPIDTGAMKSTIHVESGDTPSGFQAAVVAGGPAAPYTVRQHEDVTLRHRVGNAKFVERPFLRVLPTVAGALRKVAGGR